MNKPEIYKAHFVPHEGIYMTVGGAFPEYQESLHEKEFVDLSEYQSLLTEYLELKFRMEQLEK